MTVVVLSAILDQIKLRHLGIVPPPEQKVKRAQRLVEVYALEAEALEFLHSIHTVEEKPDPILVTKVVHGLGDLLDIVHRL